MIHEQVVRLAAFASKTELRKPEKPGSGLSSVERCAQPLAPQRAQTARTRGPAGYGLRALSLAYAAFFVRPRRLAPTVFDANAPSR